MSKPSSRAPLSVPSRTTPTWEVELLISGALVISLFQLIDPLELAFAKWIALVPSSREPVVIYSYIYSKLVLFALIGTFVLHIAARASWVALVGVHSVYPQGPRWENLSGGAITRRLMEKLTGSVDDAIERADNRATLVFGYGMLAAQMALMILIFSLVVIALSGMLSWLIDERWALLIVGALMALPIALFTGLDMLFGKRLRQGGWAARQLERGMRWSVFMSMGHLTQPLLSLVTTNIGGRRGNWLLMIVFGSILGVTVLDTVERLGGYSPLRGNALPRLALSSGVNPLHYASLRNETQRFAATPFIPEEVIAGPYLKLFLPYAPDRHDRALRLQCATSISATKTLAEAKDQAPSAAAILQKDEARRSAEAALMACFADLLQVRLDGSLLTALTLERHRDPFSGHDGGLAMIDIRTLPPGRHELEINRLPRATNSMRFEMDAAVAPDRIVFWR